MAGLASYFAFFVLSHLLILHSAQEDNNNNCSDSFSCGNHTWHLNFPFARVTQPSCGLCMLDCVDEKHPKVQLERDGPWYIATDKPRPDAIKIQDLDLHHFLFYGSCDAFNKNITLPNSPSISFTIWPNITFFKCNKNLPLPPEMIRDFPFRKYCEGYDYDVYYKHPSSRQIRTPVCPVIQLPTVPLQGNTNYSDVFKLLIADFEVEIHVSEECSDCYHKRHGQCLKNSDNEYSCSKGKSHLKVLILGTAVSAAGIGILTIIVACFVRKSAPGKSMDFWKKKTEDYQNVETFLKNHGQLALKRYCYSDVEKMTSSFKVKLGQGGYGCVYRGKLHNGSPVAVKVLNESKGNGEEFINEVASISRTSHVNIVALLGFCFESRKKALIYEFMPNGSLERFIYDANSLTDRPLGWDKLYQIAVGIARGLEYLHRGCKIRILHFDIKPHNILLDEDFCPKISDFGLAKLCPKKESIVSMLGARGTAGYIAPEVFFRSFGGVSHKSDVYSYGMMVLEMVGGRKNIDVGVNRTSEIYFPHWIYKQLELNEDLALHGIVNEKQNEIARKMIIVGLWCIQTDPANRPSMSQALDMLTGSLESLQIPPKPYLSSPPRSEAEFSTIEMT